MMAIMKDILAVQNCQTEGFGIFQEILLEKGIEHEVFHPYSEPDLFPEKNFRAVLVGGTPISVREIESHDFLKREREYLTTAVRKRRAGSRDLFWRQLIAQILGAEVKKNQVMEIGSDEIELTA